MLAKEVVFAIAGQFSRGKEIREQEYYYETIVLLILIGKRLGQSPLREHRSSTKCEALFSFEWIFLPLFLLQYRQSRRHGGALVGLAPPNKAPSPPN